MAENSAIGWTDDTWNPWMGCTKVAPGCANCYAEEMMDSRWGKVQWGPNGTRVRTSDSNWRKPLAWNRAAEKAGVPRKVFCASLADVFEDWQGPVLDHRGKRLFSYVDHNASAMDGSVGLTMSDLRRDLFGLIDQTPWLRWLLLTKRPENVRRMWPGESVIGDIAACAGSGAGWNVSRTPRHRSNVLIGTSISDQNDAAIQELLRCRDLCAGVFVSLEPMLGFVDLSKVIDPTCDQHGDYRPDWTIIGCESSGPRVGRLGEFESESAWWDAAADVVRQCRAAGVAAFVKQIPIAGRVSKELSEFPPQLQVRGFPSAIQRPGSR